ncbi:uncharacterized protein METZ01_LOCUS482480, partial [marine metagenome]
MHNPPIVGVLGLQGDFAAHGQVLRRRGVEVRVVRQPKQLTGLNGLVIPGGESTTLIKLMDVFEFWDPLREFVRSGAAVFGTCAGLIILASEVLNPRQRSLSVIDVAVERNGYGRQRESFEGEGVFSAEGTRIPMVFIRAPRIVRTGANVLALGECEGDTVIARQD